MKDFKPFLQNAWEKAGFQAFTDVQTQSLPLVLEGKDVIAESPTGTGKTLAYLLPLLQKADEAITNPQIVIVSPTRELVMQIHSEVQKFTEGSALSGASLIGGADIKRQVERLKKHPQIIVGSPGRILELIRMKKLKMHEVKTIVFDEFDQMIKQNMKSLLEDVVKTTMRDRQLLFYSATMPKIAEDAAREIANEPTIIRIKRSEETSRVKHLYVVGELREKLDNVRKIVKMDNVKAVAFMNDPFRLDDMASKLQFRKVAAGVIHSDAKKQERAATLRAFRQGKIQVVLATDVAARGLDIEGLTHVLHLDLPETVDQYIHRSGRTGRMGNEGTVISLVTPNEEKKLLQFAKKLGIQFEKLEIYKGALIEKKPTPAKKKRPAFTARKKPR
ncbi:DEAD/DEAH box helicase [Ectobacillus antri]|uniref:DEAD/DEAH box helicase n=1 Tax=Ectobacillus antri TaxID=2486280 RepID=A0ABT6H1W0_9BACI|nr:DEAD/DEAH box helicase [Ectobacillus antri]MDG4656287.1 DEAD/DEAH box helicase [Ectobacillus antri]MDG5752962.1 DEAD/DEAH box helicase [Ectobacillus antri]